MRERRHPLRGFSPAGRARAEGEGRKEMKRKMIVAAVALLITSGAAMAVEPGSIYDSPANWTAKTWTFMCFACQLDRQQDNVCRPNFKSLVADVLADTGREAANRESQANSLLIRCNACAARECIINEDKAKRPDFYARPDFYLRPSTQG